MPDTTDLFPLQLHVLSRQIEIWQDRFRLNLSEAFLCPFDLGGGKEKLDLEMFKQAFRDNGYRQPCYSIVLRSDSEFPERFLDKINQINYGDLFDRFFIDVYQQSPADDWISEWYITPIKDTAELPYSVKWDSKYKVNFLDCSHPLLPDDTGKEIYRAEIRSANLLEITFNNEKSIIAGKPAATLLKLIKYQGKELNFYDLADSSVHDFYEENVSSSDIKILQYELDSLLTELEDAEELNDTERYQCCLEKFEDFSSMLKKEFSASIKNKKIIVHKTRLTPGGKKEYDRIRKHIKSAISELMPSAQLHFNNSVSTGRKLAYKPEKVIIWEIIE
jgi:hypothetical protein